MFPAWTEAQMETSDHGLSHAFKSLGAVANGFTDINIDFVKFFAIFYWNWLH
jgi:hypothetical protein